MRPGREPTQAGSDNKLRALWRDDQGHAAGWVIAANGGLEVNNIYGPYTGWTSNGLGVGADNKMRLLWSTADGRAALWQLAAGAQSTGGGAVEVNLVFGPF